MNAALAHILVVEDEGIVAADIQDRLKEIGYRSTIAGSGNAALEIAAQLRPDLVLMDIILKGEMDGVEVAQELRRNYGIPVVFLTAHTDEKTLKRAEAAGPLGYIMKPFDEKELYSAIMVALEKHRRNTSLSSKTKTKALPRPNV